MVFHILSREELSIYGDGTKFGSSFCSTMGDWRYIHHGFFGYLAYSVYNRLKKTKSVFSVLVVYKFPDFFPEGMYDVPPERQDEFKINLIPGAAPEYQYVISPHNA